MKPLFDTPSRRSLPQRDQKTLAVLLLVCLPPLGFAVFGTPQHPLAEHDTMPVQTFRYEIDINTATAVEFRQLPGIGEKLAQTIVQDRQLNGPFKTLSDLKRVKGIGPKTLENLRPFLREP